MNQDHAGAIPQRPADTEAMRELALHMIEHCRADSFNNEGPGKQPPEDDEKEE